MTITLYRSFRHKVATKLTLFFPSTYDILPPFFGLFCLFASPLYVNLLVDSAIPDSTFFRLFCFNLLIYICFCDILTKKDGIQLMDTVPQRQVSMKKNGIPFGGFVPSSQKVNIFGYFWLDFILFGV